MRLIWFILLALCATLGFSQNEASKWYFGNYADLDFMANPPGSLNTSAMPGRRPSSIADAAGNLLFYTNGLNVWNRQNLVMPNGTLMTASNQFLDGQGPLIVKSPGSNSLYYIFYVAYYSSTALRETRYCVVDMSLNSGLGDITIKNLVLRTNSTEKLTAIKHCNNSDIWVIGHDYNSNNFTSHLVTVNGVNTTAVLSPIGPTYTNNFNAIGVLKASPNENRIGNIVRILNAGSAEIYDFDRSTGILSNQLVLSTNLNSAIGGEFSPDGTKFYAVPDNGAICWQWDLCAGTASAVAASVYTGSIGGTGLQLSINGKIYNTITGTQSLSVINNPNAAGVACNITPSAQAIGTGTCGDNLPNISSWFLKPSFNFTTMGCQTASFTAPPIPAGCATAGTPTLSSLSWIFGDPSSGPANTSTLNGPSHVFSAPGTYTVKLVLNYVNACVADTQVKVVQTPSLPTLTVSGNLNLCPGQQASLTVSGADTFTWSTSSNSSSVILNPSVTTVYTVSGTFTTSGCASSRTFTVSRSLCTGLEDLSYETEVKVYPNPFQTILYVESKKPATVLIFDQLGILHRNLKVTTGTNNLDLHDLPDGIYILKFRTSSSERNFRIVKTD